MTVAPEEERSEAAAAQADLAVAPEILANSLGEYLRGALARVKAGEAGVLPVVAGLILISALFQTLNSNFLTSGNIVNLLIQGAAYMLLAMGMVFPLLLGEIDLSIGFVSGIGGIVMAELVKQSMGWPWWAAVAVALLACAAIGAFQGTIITRLGLPAFIVTLAGLLGWQGVGLLLLGTGGSLPINDKVINNMASGNLTPAASWIVVLGIVTVFAVRLWLRDGRRRSSGLVAPPASVSLLKIGAAYLAGIAVVVVCNADRGRLVPIKGLPWVVLIVVGVLTLWTLLLGRTKFGRYIYAIGGNPEAARRAGVNLAAIRTLALHPWRRSPPASAESSTPPGCGRCRRRSTAAPSCSTRWRRPSSGGRACSGDGARPSTPSSEDW